MSTLSGNTIASTYPSLIRIDNFTGASTNVEFLTDGLGTRLPISLSTDRVRFKDTIDFKNTTSIDFSGTTWDVNAATIDFTLANTTGVIKNAAVKDAGGRQPAIEGQINYSGGTGISITEDVVTSTFTFSTTGADKQIVYIGSGITTTSGKSVYWDGTEWATSPTSSNAYNKLIGITNGTNTLTDGVIIGGLITDPAQQIYNAGDLYLGSTTGAFSETPNYTENEYIRGVGHSLGSIGIILNPDIRWEYNNNTSYLITESDEVIITNDGFAIAYE